MTYHYLEATVGDRLIALSADSVPIAYTVLGAGAPLILLHGFTETSESWHEAGYVERLVDVGRQVVLIDCRGHGRSGKPPEAAAYGGATLARDVVAVLDALDIGAADLIGYSMGGMVALATALHFPNRVHRLVVIGAHPFAQNMSPYRLAVASGVERWLAMVEAHGIRLSDDTRRRMLANDLRALQACVSHDRKDISAALAGLKAPLLGIAGTLDPIFPAVRAFVDRVDGRFLALDGSNHVTTFLAKDVILPAVEHFLSDSAGSEASLNQVEAETN